MEYLFNEDKILKSINKKRNKDILLFSIACIISIYVTIKYGFNLLTIYFYFLTILTLLLIFNIIKEKFNIRNKTNIKNFTGKIIDLFPQNENKKDEKWVIFIEEDNSKKFKTFELINKIENFNINDIVKITYTENLKIPISIKKE